MGSASASGSTPSGRKSRSNSTLSSKEAEFQNWKRRKNYDPMKAAAEGKKKEAARKAATITMSQSMIGTVSNRAADSSSSQSPRYFSLFQNVPKCSKMLRNFGFISFGLRFTFSFIALTL